MQNSIVCKINAQIYDIGFWSYYITLFMSLSFTNNKLFIKNLLSEMINMN